MKRYILVSALFCVGAMVGFIGGAAIVSKSHAHFWNMWYDTGVGESVQRMHAAGYGRLRGADEVVTILDQATANQMSGLIMREDAMPPFASRTYGPRQELDLRLLHTYMAMFPDEFSHVLAQPQMAQWPAMTIEEIQDRCQRDGLCDTAELMLQLKHLASARADASN